MESRLKILVSAYACEPQRGSEPGVGWNFVRQISRFYDVWVITRKNNRHSIESELAQYPLPNVHWVYLDLPTWARFWKKARRGAHLYYYLWQLGAYFVARKLYRQIKFDLIHHVTFVNYWRPSFLVLLPSPFIWGPVGGGDSMPLGFWSSLSTRGKVYEFFRELARRLSEFDPFVRLACRRAAITLVTTRQTMHRVHALGSHTVQIVPQVGLPEEEIRQLGRFPIREHGPFRVVSIGNLVHLKGFGYGLRAFARMQKQFPASEYWLIGEGPERKRLQHLVHQLRLEDKVKFWGELPRTEALRKLKHCDVLIHPTLHDSGGCVSLEAMAAGRPVVCLDLGGPALQMTEDTGIKIRAISPDQVVTELATAMTLMASNFPLRAQLGQAARAYVEEHFSWDKKGLGLVQLYEELTRSRA